MDEETKALAGQRVSDHTVEELTHKPWLVLVDRTNMDTVLSLATDLRDARATIRAQAEQLAAAEAKRREEKE